MTKPSNNEPQDERLLEALQDVWKSMDDTFAVEPTPLPDWTALVRERKKAARRKLWKELAILWAAAVPILGLLLLSALGGSPVFWIIQAAAVMTGIGLVAAELRKSPRRRGRGTAR